MFFTIFLLLACQLPQSLPAPAAGTPPGQNEPVTTAPAQPTSRPNTPPAQPLELPAVAPWPMWPPFENESGTVGDESASRLIFTPSLESIANPAALPALSDEQRTGLTAAGVLVLTDQPAEPGLLLNRQLSSGEPLWIGSDWVIWRTQALQNQALRYTADQIITPLLGRWLTVLAQVTAGQHAVAIASGDDLAIEAARRNLAYLTVAAHLLDPDFPIDPLVADLVQSEIDLISLGGPFESPYSGQMVDYQPWLLTHRPVARAQRWLTTVPLAAWQPTGVDLRLEARQTQLLLAALAQNSEAAELWPRLYRLEQYLNGGQGAETVWRQLQRVSPEAATADPLLESVAAAGSPPFFLLPSPHDWQTYVFDELTFNQVGLYTGPPDSRPFTAAETDVGTVRLWPHPLDLAIVQGSATARRQLDEENHTAFDRYDEQLVVIQRAFDERTVGWERLGWVALAPLLGEDQMTARRLLLWQQAIINRPDGWVQVDPGPDPTLYLEPDALLYGQMAVVNDHLRQTLAQFGVLDGETAEMLDQLTGGLKQLAVIARLQQAGRPLGDALESELHQWVGAPPAGSFPRPVTYYSPEPDAVLTIEAAVPLLAIVPLDGRPMVVGGWTFLTGLELEERN